MKANLIVYFAYNEKQESEQDKMVTNLLSSFTDFCDDAVFEFQCIPRVGEYIVAEELIEKWLKDTGYKKPSSDGFVWKKFYSALRTGRFRAIAIQHSLTTCTIECSDIEYEEVE